MKYSTAFFADANAAVATGHIMRCMSIAAHLESAMFICSDNDGAEIARTNGFFAISLESDYSKPETGIPQLINAIKEYGIERVICDSYFVTKSFFERLNQFVSTAYIDDLCETAYPVQMLINYNICASHEAYSAIYGANAPKLLLGVEYAPLRSEFLDVKKCTRENVTDIMLTLGGSDPLGISLAIARRIPADISLHIIAGRYWKSEITNTLEKYGNVKLYRNISRISEIMMKCDIAITAGGSTLYELCACKTPSISVSFADNQLPLVKEFDRRGIIPYAADARNNVDKCADKVLELLNKYLSLQKRLEASNNMAKEIDANGADRIAKKIMLI